MQTNVGYLVSSFLSSLSEVDLIKFTKHYSFAPVADRMTSNFNNRAHIFYLSHLRLDAFLQMSFRIEHLGWNVHPAGGSKLGTSQWIFLSRLADASNIRNRIQ